MRRVLFVYVFALAIAAPIGYAINFSAQFGTIDLSTGTFTPVGPGAPNMPAGIAGAPGGPFYTVDGVTGHLLRIAVRQAGSLRPIVNRPLAAGASSQGSQLIMADRACLPVRSSRRF